MSKDSYKKELLIAIREHSEAISWIKAFIAPRYHAYYSESLKEITFYEKKLEKLQAKLAKLQQ